MEERNIYKDIAQRTQGDIYIGVVGPVRTGKSTFIKRFMETLVLPNMESGFQKDRAIDELPQASAGRTIMTTEPKFIPEDSIRVEIEGKASFNVRLVDCVGYIVPSALGYFEHESPRMVVTPWFDDEIPFNMAAEIGTKKVITDHSTIGMVITTDGSITDIPREEYEEAEERVINELLEIKKPFIIILNCMFPQSQRSKEIKERLEEKYGVTVFPTNCLELDEEEIKNIMASVLFEFSVKQISLDMPRWVSSLERDHWLKIDILNRIREMANNIAKIKNVEENSAILAESEYIESVTTTEINLATGQVKISVRMDHTLFMTILSETTGLEIPSEGELMRHITELVTIKREYEKVRSALEEVEQTGYGIVMPEQDQLKLEEPEIVRQNGKFGVRLRASAPSIHMMRADIMTEVSPIVGSEKQSEELVLYMLKEFEEDPAKIWESNIFGKSLYDLVNEGLHTKLYKMPSDARFKLQETIQRIINEGCSGLICIIL